MLESNIGARRETLRVRVVPGPDSKVAETMSQVEYIVVNRVVIIVLASFVGAEGGDRKPSRLDLAVGGRGVTR